MVETVFMESYLEKFQDADFSSDYRLQALFSMIPKGGSILDIGSGNGYVALFLGDSYTHITLSDNSDILIKNLKSKFISKPNVSVVKLDAEHISIDRHLDTISVCDVLEHLSDDSACLKSCYALLEPGGKIFISVPAIPRLYGLRDTMSGHVRRYTRADLRKVVEKSGFSIRKLYYWNFLGLLPYLISEKVFKRPLSGPARNNPKGLVQKAINRVVYFWLMIETFIHPPIGLSLIVEAEKLTR